VCCYITIPVQVVKSARRCQLQLLSKLIGRARTQLVEDVIVALVGALADHASALEQVVGDVAAGHLLKDIDIEIIYEDVSDISIDDNNNIHSWFGKYVLNC
jgi:hypothetical protein